MRANAWEEIGKELKIKRKTWREDSVSLAVQVSSIETDIQCCIGYVCVL
jgi:hypothetical protein